MDSIEAPPRHHGLHHKPPTERTDITSHAPPQSASDLVPEIAPLEADVDLATLQVYAKSVASRAHTLAVRARAMAEEGADEAARGTINSAARLAALEDAAFRAERASNSVRSTLELLALDEDVDGARITLDLITSGEGQVWDATNDVLVQLEGIRNALRAHRAESEALERTKEQAREHAARALEAANQAYGIASQIAERIQDGAFSAPGVKAALDRAVSAADDAHAAAKEAEEACEAVTEAEGATSATLPAGEARTSLDAARRALKEAQEAEETAKRAETRGCAAAVSQAQHAQERARAALAGAERAILRGENALATSGSEDAKRRMSDARGALSQTQEASEKSASSAERAAAATRSSLAQEAAVETHNHAQGAEAARNRVTEGVDEVARLAGEAAARNAHLEAARDHAREVQAHANATRAHVTSRLEALGKRCEDLQDRASLELKHQADVEGGRIIEVLDELLGRTQMLIASHVPSTIEAEVIPLRHQLEETDAKRQDFDQIAHQTLEVAGDALEVLARERDAQTLLEQTIAKAQEDREKAGLLLDQARARWNELEPVLGNAQLPALIELRERAHEVIDIAEFQYGEATTSANRALEQSDIDEATEHANTTASFTQRIEEDLPEAHHILDRAESLANEERRKIEESLATSRQWFARVEQDLQYLETVLEETHEVSARWRNDDRVGAAVQQLSAALVPDPTVIEQKRVLAEQTEHVGTSGDAAKLIPRSEELARQSAQHCERAASLFEQLKARVTEVEGEANAITDARHAIENAISLALAHTDQVANAKRQLMESLETTHATGPAAQEALQRLESLETSALSYKNQIEVEQQEFYASSSAEQSRVSSGRVLELITTLEQLAEQAKQTAETGALAAQDELRAKQQSDARVDASLREEIQASADSVRENNRRLAGALAQASPELEGSDDPSVLASQDQVKEFLRSNEELGAKALKLSERAENEQGEHLGTVKDQVNQIALLTQERVESALGILQSATDTTRASAKEQEAVDKIKQEVITTVARAQQALTRVLETAQSVENLAGEDSQTLALLRDLIDASKQQAKLAESTVLKAQAAQPMAEQAESLPVAQRVLDGSRKAAARVEGTVRSTEQHLVDARSRVRAATEAATRAFDEAKARGTLPASEAMTLANTAERWLESAKATCDSVEAVAIQEASGVLEAAVRAARDAASISGAASQRAQAADSIEQAQKASDEAIQASEQVKKSTEEARAARRELLHQMAIHEEALERLSAARTQAEEFSKQAEKVALQARTSSDAFDEKVGTLGAEPTVLLNDTMSTIRQAAQDAEACARQTQEHVQNALKTSTDVDAEQSSAEAGVSLAQGLEALERLVLAEEHAKKELGRIQEEAAEAQRIEDESSRKAEMEARLEQERQREAQQEQEQELQRQQLEERRARFGQRKQASESVPQDQGAASGRDALRSRLKSGRGPAQPSAKTQKRPSRIDDRLGRRPASSEGDETRAVRSYTPGDRTVGARSIRRRQRPSADAPPTSSEDPKD